MSSLPLTDDELAALDRLEDEHVHGDSIRWDGPKTIKGVVCREVETLEFVDRNDDSTRTKRVIALRTADGIVTVWEGPGMLTSRLFDGEQQDAEPIGPPTKGQLVIIDYRGERTSQAGREYKFFDVARGSLPAEAEQPPPFDDAEADAIAAEQAEKAAQNDDIPF